MLSAKNWCFWTVVLEKTFESPLDCKINQFILKEISPGCSLEGLMLKLKLQYFGLLMRRVDPDAEKVWGQEEKGMTEDEMVGCHHQLNGHEFEQTPGDSRGQGSLACWSPCGCKSSDRTEQLKWMHSNGKQNKVYAFSLDTIQIIESWSTLVDLMTNVIIFNFLLFCFVGVLCNKKELTTNYLIPSMSLNLRKLVASPDLWFHSNSTELYQQIHFDTFETQL